MPSVYGDSGGSSGGLYGQGDTHLSESNYKQAQQLGLPGAVEQPGGTQGAGSQQEAQSDYANFEDIFNKNRGYAAKGVKDAVGQVEGAAEPGGQKALTATVGNQGQQSPAGSMMSTYKNTGPKAQATAAPAPTQNAVSGAVNPSAPATLQSDTIQGVQQKADMLAGYGPQLHQDEDPDYGGMADTAEGTGVAPAPAQTATDANGNPVDPFTYHPGDVAPSYDAQGSQVDPANNRPTDNLDPADTDGNGQISVLEEQMWERAHPGEQHATAPAAPASGAGVDPNTQAARDQAAADLAASPFDPTKPFSDADLAKLDQLTKANDLLKSWGTDEGEALLQKTNPEAGAWDAALMQTGGGRDQLARLQKSLGGKDEEFNTALAKKAADAKDLHNRNQKQVSIFDDLLEKQKNAAANRPAPALTPAADGSSGVDAPGQYGKYTELMGSDGGPDVQTTIHNLGMALSPAEQAEIAAGRAGVYKGQTGAEYFRSSFGAGADIGRENMKIALTEISQQMGPDLASWAYEHIPTSMQKELAGANYGYIVHVLTELLKDNPKYKALHSGSPEAFWNLTHPGQNGGLS